MTLFAWDNVFVIGDDVRYPKSCQISSTYSVDDVLDICDDVYSISEDLFCV